MTPFHHIYWVWQTVAHPLFVLPDWFSFHFVFNTCRRWMQTSLSFLKVWQNAYHHKKYRHLLGVASPKTPHQGLCSCPRGIAPDSILPSHFKWSPAAYVLRCFCRTVEGRKSREMFNPGSPGKWLSRRRWFLFGSVQFTKPANQLSGVVCNNMLLWPPYVIGGHYIFSLWLLSFFPCIFFFLA